MSCRLKRGGPFIKTRKLSKSFYPLSSQDLNWQYPKLSHLITPFPEQKKKAFRHFPLNSGRLKRDPYNLVLNNHPHITG